MNKYGLIEIDNFNRGELEMFEKDSMMPSKDGQKTEIQEVMKNDY